MADLYAVPGETLSEIANAIRAKTGNDDFMTVSAMASAIAGISGESDNIKWGLVKSTDYFYNSITLPIDYTNYNIIIIANATGTYNEIYTLGLAMMINGVDNRWGTRTNMNNGQTTVRQAYSLTPKLNSDGSTTLTEYDKFIEGQDYVWIAIKTT